SGVRASLLGWRRTTLGHTVDRTQIRRSAACWGPPCRDEVLPPAPQEGDAPVQEVLLRQLALRVTDLDVVHAHAALPHESTGRTLALRDPGGDQRVDDGGAHGHWAAGELGSRVGQGPGVDLRRLALPEEDTARGLDLGRRLSTVDQGRDVRGEDAVRLAQVRTLRGGPLQLLDLLAGAQREDLQQLAHLGV